MGKIVYEVTSGKFPITVDLAGDNVPGGLQNIHSSYGTYEFDNVPLGIYTLTFSDATTSEVCEFVEVIDPCVSCPPGYVPIGNTCQKTDIVAATEYLPLRTLVDKRRIEYSSRGTLIFENDWTYGGTGTFEKISSTNEYWTNDWTSTIRGPMNRSAVWVTPYTSLQDIQFSVCIDIALPKIYYVGIGSDNWSYIRLNGERILDQDLNAIAAMLGVTSNKDRPPFNYWFIYPIFLNEGRNVLEVGGHNEYNVAAVGVEVYDATPETLKAVTSDVELGDALLFRAKQLLGGYASYEWSPGSGYHGYECPPGYALVTCEEPYHCVRKEVLECGQLFAEVEYAEMTYSADCSLITYPHLSNTAISKDYIMPTYFEPDRPTTEFESIEIVRVIADSNAYVRYNGSPLYEGQIITFAEASAIQIYTQNYLEEDTVTDIFFKIHLVGESLPTQELQFRFINEACEYSAKPVAMYVSIDVVLGGDYDFGMELPITYNPGNEVTFSNPIATGYHYMFVSLPSGHPFVIKDALNTDITDQFTFVQTDNRENYANNSIYRYGEPFGTNAPVTFKLTLS